jgi:hypothetical protein
VVFHAVSNTPFDLKTVIVCAFDLCVVTPPTRIKRLFKSILWQYQGASATFVPMCQTLARGNPLANNGIVGAGGSTVRAITRTKVPISFAKFWKLPSAQYLVQSNRSGIEHNQKSPIFGHRGGIHEKRSVF